MTNLHQRAREEIVNETARVKSFLSTTYGRIRNMSYGDVVAEQQVTLEEDPHPLMSAKDIQLFYKYLDAASVYFEWGSGGSTYQASIRSNIKRIYSVEGDKAWHEKLKSWIPDSQRSKIEYLYTEIHAPPNGFSYPGKEATEQEMAAYSERLSDVPEHERKQIDMIVIDGRFRPACALRVFNDQVLKPDVIVAIHDFFPRRGDYGVVLDYFDVIDETSDCSLVILQKKAGATPPSDAVVGEYKLNPKRISEFVSQCMPSTGN